MTSSRTQPESSDEPQAAKRPRRTKPTKTKDDTDSLARFVLDVSPALLAFVGADERYRLANRPHEQWLNVKPESLVGRHVRAVFGGGVYAVLRPHIKRALEGRDSRGEATIPWLDGGTRWIAIDATPRMNARQKAVDGFVLRIVDIDTQKRARQELLRSERDLADLLENAAEGMHWIGPDGVVQWANRAQLELLGHDREEYVGLPIAQMFLDPDVAEDFMARLRRHESLRDYEARLRCWDGSAKYVLINSNCVWEAGKLVHTRCFIRDITERRVAELLQSMEKRILELVAQDEQLERVLGTLASYVERLAPDLMVSILLQGDGTPRLVVDGTPQLPGDVIRSLAERRELTVCNDVATDPDWAAWRDAALGAEVRACWSNPIVSSRNRPLGTLAIYCRQARSPIWRDLMLLASAAHVASIAIERRALDDERAAILTREQAVRASAEKLAETLDQTVRARDDFLSMASHELRNPINTMQLQVVSVLRSAESTTAPVPPWAMQRLKKLMIQIRRLVRLIDNLMDVTRMTSGRMELDLEEVDLETVVREVVERSRDEIGEVEVKVQAVPTFGRWDRLRLDQVVTNLLSNALKYGKGHPVELEVSSDAQRATLRVRDYGIGMTDESQARIFQRFERAVSGRVYSGFGLGLWITNEIVTTMGGSVRVASKLGEGAEFTVELPRHA